MLRLVKSALWTDKNPLIELGRKKLFEEPSPREAVTHYIKLLWKHHKIATRQDYRSQLFLIKMLPAGYLKRNGAESRFKVDNLDELTVRDAYKYLVQHLIELEFAIQSDPDYRPMRPWAKASADFAKRGAFVALAALTIFALPGWVQSLGDSFWDFRRSENRLVSYRARDSLAGHLLEENLSPAEIRAELKTLTDLLYVKINSEFTSIQQVTRNQPAYIGHAVATVENSLMLAEMVEELTGDDMSSVTESSLRFLYDLESSFPDILSTNLGQPIQARIDQAFTRYDPDRRIRDSFEK